jgi:cob(I)alamin adenosyltransferase
MSIYTKKGDRGETGIFNGQRLSKDSLLIETVGVVDEANTFLGLTAAFAKDKKLREKIIKIQRNLFEIGAILAGAKPKMDKNLPKKMEKEIDEMDKVLPVLSHFILPGGGKTGSLLFMARTFVRRAERRVVALSKKEKVSSNLLVFLNRLSDYVFTLARYSNFKEGVKEEIWKSVAK